MLIVIKKLWTILTHENSRRKPYWKEILPKKTLIDFCPKGQKAIFDKLSVWENWIMGMGDIIYFWYFLVSFLHSLYPGSEWVNKKSDKKLQMLPLSELRWIEFILLRTTEKNYLYKRLFNKDGLIYFFNRATLNFPAGGALTQPTGVKEFC